MEVGTGIFLSSIFLGTVALFIFTKDRWNWKKIILWSIGIVILVPLAFFVALKCTELLTKESPVVYSNPQRQDVFWELTFEDAKADVKFKKGEPKIHNPDLWEYKIQELNGSESSYLIRFNGEKIRYIMYQASNLSIPTAPYFIGKTLGDSSAEVFRKFGKPSEIANTKDELNRLYSYEMFNLFFVLERDKVISYGIYNPSLGPMRFSGN